VRLGPNIYQRRSCSHPLIHRLVTGKTRMRGRPQFGYLFHRITIPLRNVHAHPAWHERMEVSQPQRAAAPELVNSD
jgi:hypothetical protein